MRGHAAVIDYILAKIHANSIGKRYCGIFLVKNALTPQQIDVEFELGLALCDVERQEGIDDEYETFVVKCEGVRLGSGVCSKHVDLATR